MNDTAPVTVVTGASGALGSKLVEVLCARGHQVAAVDRRESGEALERIAEVQREAVLALPFDVTVEEQWLRAQEHIERTFGPATGAVLAAGGYQGGTPLHAGKNSVWKAMQHANLETARVSLEALLPTMVRQRRGSVVVVGSRAAERPWESANAAAYAAAKAGVVALARAVASEVLSYGVRVNAVLPSIIDTPANRRAMPNADFQAWVLPESLAEVVVFLLSDAARDVSGATLPVYGRS
jgi:NAD(P)-dependent dehydrogenase (short-subunit alcohol dehydrogenase family)